MSAGIYKKQQGYYTRMSSAFALATLVFMGAIWLWDLLGGIKIGEFQSVYVQATGAVILIAFFGILGFYLIGRKPRVVDFLIATEGEMKKVNWSSRREIVGSTIVVISLTVLIAALCFIFDLGFQAFFKAVGVLKEAKGA